MIIPKEIIVQLKIGDIVLVYSFNNGEFKAYVIISSPNVSYSTFVKALGNKTIDIVSMDYTIPKAIQEQFDNSLSYFKESIFGKEDGDSISPNAYFDVNNFQDGKIKIPLTQTISKYSLLSTYLKYNVENISFTFYIKPE
jgi:hypothetical protein